MCLVKDFLFEGNVSHMSDLHSTYLKFVGLMALNLTSMYCIPKKASNNSCAKKFLKLVLYGKFRQALPEQSKDMLDRQLFILWYRTFIVTKKAIFYVTLLHVKYPATNEVEVVLHKYMPNTSRNSIEM